MRAALEQARLASSQGEVPVGAVAVRQGQLLARGHNLRNHLSDLLGHAEMVVLRRAARILGDWRLNEVDIYVTLEPCPMCAGAMLQARVRRLYYGAKNPREGCAGSILNLADYPGMAHQMRVYGGLLELDCRNVLEEFFNIRRGG